VDWRQHGVEIGLQHDQVHITQALSLSCMCWSLCTMQGSGMIHPNMATMLGVVTCDAAVAADAWRDMVRRASIASFNQITVSSTTTHELFVRHVCCQGSRCHRCHEKVFSSG
jgi:N-acetylglutamate synthase/N-acetylornithine aminotransferase